MYSRPQSRPIRDGFTLTELLVSIGIICVLAAILFPVLLSARAASQQSVCASNLRQIGTAMSQYVSDYDGRYPPSSTGLFVVTKETKDERIVEAEGEILDWSELLLPYAKTFPRCPQVECTKNCDAPTSAGYTLNANVAEWKPAPGPAERSEGKSESHLTAPSLVVLVLDGRAHLTERDAPDEYESPDGVKYTVNGSRAGAATRHRGGANYLFADNHVKWYKPRQLSIAKKNDGKPGFGL